MRRLLILAAVFLAGLVEVRSDTATVLSFYLITYPFLLLGLAFFDFDYAGAERRELLDRPGRVWVVRRGDEQNRTRRVLPHRRFGAQRPIIHPGREQREAFDGAIGTGFENRNVRADRIASSPSYARWTRHPDARRSMAVLSATSRLSSTIRMQASNGRVAGCGCASVENSSACAMLAAGRRTVNSLPRSGPSL